VNLFIALKVKAFVTASSKMSEPEDIKDKEPIIATNEKIPGTPGAIVVAEDPEAPSAEVSSKRQSLSDIFTIVCRFYP